MGQYSDITDPNAAPPLWPFLLGGAAIGLLIAGAILWFTAC